MPEVITQVDPEKLSGRELDAAVAERVMGLTEVQFVGERLQYHVPELGADRGGRWTGTVPYYSEEIKAAMEVVEKMDGEKWCVWIISQVRKGPKWAVSFEAKDRHEGNAAGDSLPEAICRAALAAIQSQQK